METATMSIPAHCGGLRQHDSTSETAPLGTAEMPIIVGALNRTSNGTAAESGNGHARTCPLSGVTANVVADDTQAVLIITPPADKSAPVEASKNSSSSSSNESIRPQNPTDAPIEIEPADPNDMISVGSAPLSMDSDLVNSFEVDDDTGDDSNGVARSIYASSRYPTVPVAYRTEHLETATISSSARSLYADDLEFTFENGRRYLGDNLFPNDELEQDRMRLMHQVYLNVMDFRLTTVELDNPTYILDIGTGTGEWAIGMSEEFPDCEVVGVDNAPIQPSAVPHNCFFELDDCEIEWMRVEDSADLIHMRDLAGMFQDWNFVYTEAFKHLKPGGYLEVIDFEGSTNSSTFLNYFSPDSHLCQLIEAISEALAKTGRQRGTAHMNTRILQQIGFSDIHFEDRQIALNPREDSVAKLWLVALLHAVEASSLRLLTKYLGWDVDRVLVLCDAVCMEIKEKALRTSTDDVLLMPMRIMTARKPRAPGTTATSFKPPASGPWTLPLIRSRSTIV